MGSFGTSGALAGADRRPLLAHVVYRFDVGGLENGVVNLINRLPAERFRHAVISLTECTSFSHRLTRSDVSLHALHKRPGKDFDLYRRLWRQFRTLRPQLVHTRNLATLEAQLPAMLAGAPCRIHGEHGWDVHDLDGSSRKYRSLRRAFRPLVHQYVALSRDIEGYLAEHIGVPAQRLERICNGVDTDRFVPRAEAAGRTHLRSFAPDGMLVLGTVGRLEQVKDQTLLARAFVALLRQQPDLRERVRLVIVGEGSLRGEIEAVLRRGGVADLAWLPGSRDEVPDLMREMDVFVLPSRAEGISNTLLEAAATGLPVVATQVGGNSELILDDVTGCLVPAGDVPAMVDALDGYLRNPERRLAHGRAARARAQAQAQAEFSLNGMIDAYAFLVRSTFVTTLPGKRCGHRSGAFGPNRCPQPGMS